MFGTTRLACDRAKVLRAAFFAAMNNRTSSRRRLGKWALTAVSGEEIDKLMARI
jgi:hypothetical protein